MKLKSTLAAFAIALTSQANAASYIISNVVSGDGTADALYQDVNDSLLDGGIVALGYFTGGTPSSSLNDITTTIAGFTLQASALTGSNSVNLGGSFAGYVEADLVSGATISGSNALIGQSMYVFVGNAATLETSTAWALASIGTIQDDVPFNQEYNANPLGVTPLIGSVGSYTGNASGFGSSTYNTLKLAAVPEPSAALLGAIGAVLLVVRRRRN
jgi:MYXO-CTERM domain-containing protein